jgi:hypothetical protein
MPQSPSQNPDDPFDGLLLPMSAWKALEDAKITSLEQLKTISSTTAWTGWLPGEPCGSG